MDRMSRLFAALRVMLVAVSVCLLGTASPTQRAIPDAADATAIQPAHVEDSDRHDPPAVAEKRSEDPSGAEDDDVAHGPRIGLHWLAGSVHRVHPIRGPPPAPRGVTWRPRSSRGPPAQV